MQMVQREKIGELFHLSQIFAQFAPKYSQISLTVPFYVKMYPIVGLTIGYRSETILMIHLNLGQATTCYLRAPS